MASSSPTNHERVATMKTIAAGTLARGFPKNGSVELLARQLVRSLCRVPALDYEDAVQAVTELIDEGKLSFHWMEGQTPMGRFVFGPKEQFDLLGGSRPAVTFDYCLVRVEDFDWLRTAAADAEKWCREGEVSRGADADAGNPESRLLVNLPGKTATLDGVVYDVTSAQALRWLKVLADHPGEWIAGRDLRAYDDTLDGVRTDKLRVFLPDAISALIESGTGKGSRFNPGATPVTMP